jgi:hypothetical protein
MSNRAWVEAGAAACALAVCAGAIGRDLEAKESVTFPKMSRRSSSPRRDVSSSGEAPFSLMT